MNKLTIEKLNELKPLVTTDLYKKFKLELNASIIKIPIYFIMKNDVSSEYVGESFKLMNKKMFDISIDENEVTLHKLDERVMYVYFDLVEDKNENCYEVDSLCIKEFENFVEKFDSLFSKTS